jgi:hypothetical protein
MQKLYVERLAELLLPDPRIRDEGKLAAKALYQKGNINGFVKSQGVSTEPHG